MTTRASPVTGVAYYSALIKRPAQRCEGGFGRFALARSSLAKRWIEGHVLALLLTQPPAFFCKLPKGNSGIQHSS